MNKTFWFDNSEKSISFNWVRKGWKEVGNKPRITFHENGGRKKNGDKCFDCTLCIGYLLLSYTNWNIQKKRGERDMKKKQARCWMKNQVMKKNKLSYRLIALGVLAWLALIIGLGVWGCSR